MYRLLDKDDLVTATLIINQPTARITFGEFFFECYGVVQLFSHIPYPKKGNHQANGLFDPQKSYFSSQKPKQGPHLPDWPTSWALRKKSFPHTPRVLPIKLYESKKHVKLNASNFQHSKKWIWDHYQSSTTRCFKGSSKFVTSPTFRKAFYWVPCRSYKYRLLQSDHLVQSSNIRNSHQWRAFNTAINKISYI